MLPHRKASTITVPVAALAAALVLAACGGETVGILAAQPPAECAAAPAGDAGAGSATGHGSPRRDEGMVEVSRDGTQFVARRRARIANDFGAAMQADVTLGTQNGSVSACANQGGGYATELRLEARAASEAEARRGLDSLSVNHSDMLAAGTLRLSTTVQFAATAGGMTVGSDIQRRADVIAGLPPAASYALRPSSSNGAVRASGLSGSSAALRSSNGAVTLDGRWDTGSLVTDNGILSVSGDYARLTADGGNGLVEGDLAVRRSLVAEFSADNGSVDVRLDGSAPGYDLTARTSNGTASIEVAGTVAVGEQTRTSARRRTPDYDSRAVKAQVTATTTNGSVRIHQ